MLVFLNLQNYLSMCVPNMFRVICSSVALSLALSASAQSPDPQTLFQEAVAAQQRGDDASAVRLYQQLLQTHPESTIVRANLGVTLAHLKRFDDAIEQYRVVLQSDPHNLPVRLNLALAYEEKGDPRQAVSELEFIHENEPGNVQASVLLADCYFRLERYSETTAILEPLEATMADDLDLAWLLGSALIRVGRSEQGLQRIDKVAQKAQNADAYLLAGQTRLALTEYDLARRDADAAVRLNPSLPGLQTLNGMILEQTGNYTAAEAALRQALKTDPQDFNAHFYLGAILYFRREMKEAKSELQRSLELRSTSAPARYELALVLRGEGNLDAAIQNLEAVARESPDWLQPHIELSALYYRTRRPEDGAKQREIVDRLTSAHQGPALGPMP
jgi:tetratricopeptide (TPR) repeat protein